MKKMLFLFSLDSNSIFGKIAPFQILRLNFRNKSDSFSYDFLFKLSAISYQILFQSSCIERAGLREESDVIYLRV